MELIRTMWLSAIFFHACVLPLQAFERPLTHSQLTEYTAKQSIESIINTLKKDYIFPEKVSAITVELKRDIVVRKLLAINETSEFTQALSLLLRRVSGDEYLNVSENNHLIKLGKQTSITPLEHIENWGIDDIEILSEKIAYLKINHFYRHENAKLKIASAFAYFSNTRAMILDLRAAEGESLEIAQYIMSYFIETNTLLSEIKYDRQNQTEALLSFAVVNSEPFKNDYPLYILTSPFMSSTAEFLSYTAQHLDKAVIVGTKTLGISYILSTKKINEQMNIDMPIALFINPKTKTNWEGEGVVPDFYIEQKQSLDEALKLARYHLRDL